MAYQWKHFKKWWDTNPSGQPRSMQNWLIRNFLRIQKNGVNDSGRKWKRGVFLRTNVPWIMVLIVERLYNKRAVCLHHTAPIMKIDLSSIWQFFKGANFYKCHILISFFAFWKTALSLSISRDLGILEIFQCRAVFTCLNIWAEISPALNFWV